jgi:hypothetical protein
MQAFTAEYTGLTFGDLNDGETEAPGAVAADEGEVGLVSRGTRVGPSTKTGVLDVPDM